MLNIFSFVVALIDVVGVLFSLRQAYRARLRQFEENMSSATGPSWTLFLWQP
jgi:hypothetical protein